VTTPPPSTPPTPPGPDATSVLPATPIPGFASQPTSLGASAGEADAVRAALSKDYEVFEELGRGGMAVVYRAKERSLQREVAIKVLPVAMTFETEVVERFEREARTAGQLEHPNIVPIYGVGRAGPDNNVIFFVMKMLRGQALSAVLRGRGRLDVKEIRQILEQTASALSFAAKKGVVHRDIKPDNILLDDEGRCIVTDFGIAKTRSGPQTVTGTSMGTPRYMSPEQAQGTPVDGRSDIYSLGVVAYECLAGRTPFDADNPFAILYKHINDTIPRPTLTTPEQWQIYGIIQKMLHKKPEDRYQTADELLSALGANVSSPTLKAAAPTRISKMVPTEVISTSGMLLMPWWRRQAWIRTIESNLARFGIRFWHVGVAVAGIIAIMVTQATLAANARADSVRLAEERRVADSVALAEKTRADSINNARIADSVSKAIAAQTAAAAKAKAAAALAAARRAPAAREAFSRCPATGSPALAKMSGEPVLMADSIPTYVQGDTLRLNYDVCGLKAGTAFSTEVTMRKLRQNRIGRVLGGGQSPVRISYPDAATSPRARRTRAIPLAVSTGVYEAEIIITDAQGRKLTVKREFDINARPRSP
jgi:serine/threonine protein kinase